jgi:hypothetical protein
MRNSETVWTFETKAFRIECLFSPDEYVDTSFDETGETQENIASGLWYAFATEVRVIHKDTGAELGSDHLGGSIYANPLDFLSEHKGSRGRHGSYFKDMVGQAVSEARGNLRKLQGVYVRAGA